MLIRRSKLDKIINDYLGEGIDTAIAKGWLPYASKENGNLFRAWVNDNKTASEIAAIYPDENDKTLGRTGPSNNSHVRKAWRAFGDEFIESMSEPEEAPGIRDRVRSRRQRDEDESGTQDRSSSPKTPCIIFTGEFSPATDPAIEQVLKRIDASDLSEEKKERAKARTFAVVRKIPEGHGGTILIEPPKAGSTKGTAYAYEFGRYGGTPPAELDNKLADGLWKTMTFDREMDRTGPRRKKFGLAIPGRTEINRLGDRPGTVNLVLKPNGNYTIEPEEAKKLVEQALSRGGYPGTTRNPIIVDGCNYERAAKFGGPDNDWRPYLLVPGLLSKIITNIVGGDFLEFDNCGTYALKVALTGVYGGWSRIATSFMPLLAAPESAIRFARVLFPQSWSPKKVVKKQDILDYRTDAESEIGIGGKRKKSSSSRRTGLPIARQ